MQPQVRLILPIFNRPRPVLVNLNSQVFFVPWPTSPKSHTVFSKEILGKWFSAAKANLCMLIDNERIKHIKTNSIKSLFRYISHFTCSYGYNRSFWCCLGQQGLFSQLSCRVNLRRIRLYSHSIHEYILFWYLFYYFLHQL